MSKSKISKQIKATLALTKASLISMMTNPSSLVFGLIFPLIFIVIFGLIGGNGGSLDVYLTKESDKNSPIYKVLDDIDVLNFKEFNSSDEAEKELKNGNIAGIVTIKTETVNNMPKSKLELTTSKASQQNGSLLVSLLSGVSNTINLQTVDQNTLPILFDHEEVSGRRYKQIDFILPGQLGFALLSAGVFGTAFVLMSLKETLVLKRFFATPIRKGNILVAEGISRLVYSTLQAAVIIGVGYFFFDFTLIHGFSTFIQMLLVSTVGLFVFLGFGLFVSSIAKDQNSIPTIANLFTLPQFLLAGTFFPIELFPEWLQPISKALPLTYMNNALRAIAFEGANITDVLPEIGALLIWIVIVYVATAKLFKWEK